MANLVDNTVKYGQPGTPIDIIIEGAPVTVRDRWRGISEADLGHIFDRYSAGQWTRR